MYLSNVEIYCEVIIIILTYKRDRKGPWGQEINDFEATTADRNFYQLQLNINNYRGNFLQVQHHINNYREYMETL